MREDRVGEEVGVEFDELGMRKRSAKIEVVFARAAEEKYKLGLGLDPSGGRGGER